MSVRNTPTHRFAPRPILTQAQEAWPEEVRRDEGERAPANDGSAEMQYLLLVARILAHGHHRSDRTGTGTRAVHGATMRFDCSQGHIPLLTTKKVDWRAVAHELLWFLSGDTNIRALLQHNVHIWSDWPWKAYQRATGDRLSMKAFEQRVLSDAAFAARWGSIGPGYGAQWRAWQGPDGALYDQVADVVARIKSTPDSRRLLWHGWNVAHLDEMALPPCHLLYQFFVADGRLSLTMYQRSCDMGLGVPFNIASCGMLLHLMAEATGLKPGDFFWVGHDVHVYDNHADTLRVQLTRVPRAFPRLDLLGPPPATLFDTTIDRLGVADYHPDAPLRMPVAV